MGLKIRRAAHADLDEIVLMLADDPLGSGREDATVPAVDAYQHAFRAINEDKNQFLAVAERDGTVVGCLQLSFIPGLSRKGLWRGQIESVRTLARERGRGVGAEMFRWAIGMCQSRGCGLVQLTTDKSRPDALRFYEGLGFVASHEGMKLDLSETSR